GRVDSRRPRRDKESKTGGQLHPTPRRTEPDKRPESGCAGIGRSFPRRSVGAASDRRARPANAVDRPRSRLLPEKMSGKLLLPDRPAAENRSGRPSLQSALPALSRASGEKSFLTAVLL